MIRKQFIILATCVLLPAMASPGFSQESPMQYVQVAEIEIEPA